MTLRRWWQIYCPLLCEKKNQIGSYLFDNYLPVGERYKMKTNQYLVDFYNNYDENSRLEKKHGSVEFLTTMRYIKRYIKAGDHVLEIGAGTGRYSHTLARQGYTFDAVASSRSRPWAQIWLSLIHI